MAITWELVRVISSLKSVVQLVYDHVTSESGEPATACSPFLQLRTVRVKFVQIQVYGAAARGAVDPIATGRS